MPLALGCSKKTMIKVANFSSYLIMYLWQKMINAKKSDLFDIIWKYVTLIKICIENGQINTTKNCKIFKWS